MKLASHKHDPMKRKLLTLLASLPMVAACRANSDTVSDDPEVARLQKKFRGIYGVVLRLDATSPKHGITITDGSGRYISAPGGLGPKGIGNQTYTDNSMPIPRAIRAVWREGAGWNSVKKVWDEGFVVGDYTVPVAERIPDSVLDYIRKNGGALRLKIRLADDGILIGWDVERRIPQPNCVKTPGNTCFQLEYFMTGGDFKEFRPAHFTGDSTFPYSITLPMSDENKAFLEKHGLERWYNGDIWEKGWYIDKNGRKVLTDY